MIDEGSNLGSRASLPTTANFDDWYRLFGGYDADRTYKGPCAGPGVTGQSGRGPGNGESNGNEKGHGD